jgi:hypothetical protein
MNSASAQTITLPAAPPSANCCVFVQNIGAGVLTVTDRTAGRPGFILNPPAELINHYSARLGNFRPTLTQTILMASER